MPSSFPNRIEIPFSPQAIRRELPILLSHLHQKEEVFSCLSRMGVWCNEYHYRNQKKHQQLRETWRLSSN